MPLHKFISIKKKFFYKLKAKQILGLLYRCFYHPASSDTLKKLYLSVVHPHLDYACQIWDPHLVEDKKILEDVQKLACRLTSQQWDSSYQDLLQLYELPSLEERRLNLRLGLMFKIMHNLISRYTILNIHRKLKFCCWVHT